MMKHIKLEIVNTAANHFIGYFGRPGRIELSTVDGRVIAHFYEGTEIDMEQEPLFCFDGTLDVCHDCKA